MTDINFAVIAHDRASNVFRAVGAEAGKSSSMMTKFAKVSAVAAVGLGAVTAAAGIFAYKVGSDYVGSLNKIQALTGANDKTMQAAAKTLESNSGLYAKMGQTTGDAAGGVVELTKAGLSLHDSLKAVNATMVLAKAGELSVSDASTLVANSLNTFGLKAKDAGKIANQLANAANISSANVSDLAESFKYVSPVAASAGVSMGQVNAILAELSNSGIKASQAGTALRTFLLNLQAPAAAGAKALDSLNVQVFDAQGNMKPLPQLIGELGSKLNGLPAKEKAADLKAIFGKVGIAGATTILKNGTDGLAKYTQGVNRAGAAQRLADANSKGLAGTLAMLKAQTTSTAQSLYRQYSPAVNDALLKTIQFAKHTATTSPALASLGREFKKAHPAILDFVKAIKSTGPPLSKMAHDLGLTASTANGKASPAWLRLGRIVGVQVVHYFANWIRTAGQVVTGLDQLGRNINGTAQAALGLGRAFGTAGSKAAAFAGSIGGKIRAAVGNLSSTLYGAGQAVIDGLISGITSKISALGSKLASVGNFIKDHKGPIEKDRKLLRPAGQAIMDGLMAGIKDRQLPLQTALSRVTDLISKVGDKIANLKSTQAGFKGTFSADSVFGTDMSGGGGIGDLIAAQQAQATQAAQLAADIKTVTSKGLSKALVRQIQSQGTSGAAALHALAGGSTAQIAQLNALNKQTSQSLQSAGMRAGNYVRGGSIAGDIKRAERQDRILERLEHHLKDLAASEKKGQTIIVEIDSEAVIRAVHRRNKRKGVKSAGL